MNAADLMHSGNFHGPASCGRFHAAASFDGDSTRLVSTNLIHVPGLPSKHHQQTQYSQQKQQLSEEGRGVLQNQPALQPSASNPKMKRELVGRQLLLLYFYHASKCSSAECQCRNGAYLVKYKLWAHMTTCPERQCNYPCCSASRTLMRHHIRCRNKCCPVCGPVRTKLSSNRYAQSSNSGATEFINSVPVSSHFNSSVGFNINLVENYRTSVLDTTQDEQPPIERMIEPAFSNCSQQEVRRSQASAKIPCEMQGLSQTQTQPSEQQSRMLKSAPLKSIPATSACNRRLDKLALTKRRKIGPTSLSCSQWEVERDPSEMEVFTQTQLFLQSGNDSRMMKSDILKTISVKPVPMMLEQSLRSQQAPFQQNCVLNESTFWIPQADQGQIQEKEKNTELGISFSANAPEQAIKETMEVEQEVKSTPEFTGISSRKEGLAQTQTQGFLPTGHDSDMMKTEISKTIEVNHIHVKMEDVQPLIKRKYIETALPTCSRKEVETKKQLVAVESPCEMQGVSQMKTQKCQPKRHNLDIKNYFSANAPKQAVKETMEVEQEVKSTPEFTGISSRKEGLAQTQTQSFLPIGHHSDMMKTEISKTIEVNHIHVKMEDVQPLIKRKYIETALPTCSRKEVETKKQLVAIESSCEMQGVSQMKTQKCQPKRHNLDIKNSFSANAPKQAVKETMEVEQEVKSTPEFTGISSRKEGLAQTQTQGILPTGHDSDMMNTEISKTIEVNHIHVKMEDVQPLIKRKYIETALPTCSRKEVETKTQLVAVESPCEMQGVSQMKTQKCQPKTHNLDIKNSSSLETIKAEPALVYIEQTENSQQGPFQKIDELNKDTLKNPHAEHGKFGRPKKTKVQAVSLIEFFNCEQIREHIKGLQQWVGQRKKKAGNKKGDKICTLCNVGKLTFRVPPMYCSLCPARIKPKASYYFVEAVDASHTICTSCYNKIPSDVVMIDENAYAKSKLMKKKNDEVAKEEVWVQCDDCKEWQHIICALFNGKRHEEGMTEYTCPNCYIEQIERGVRKPLPQKAVLRTKDLPTSCLSDHMEQRLCGRLRQEREERAEALGKSFEEGNIYFAAEYPNCYVEQIKGDVRKPLPQSAVLGAKALPSTFLSGHIEQRLFRRLKEERQERAKALGKNFEEVPGAEALIVRVVSSVDKVLEVKQQFLDMFQHQNYSSEFPYKSKVLLLFQKIEGVEVCLFAMFVQEFGSECSHPNQRGIYLSYLDSVRYFRPDVKTMNGEALRTFVYHEILIGYLDYCKSRGLTSCYIWACPPLKGEDYILYCHPETQKTPKSDKLREWYLTMLCKASKEDIVVDVTNIYDYFFVSTGERKAKVTAARLPYFDGDYWPGVAEEMIMQIQREEADGQKHQKNKKYMTKRSLKAAAQTDVADNTSKDALLMKKLGDSLHPMKEDFIMVHLQHACTHCCLFIVSGKRWVCKQCENFQLCEKCYEAEQKLDERERHPVNNREKHMFFPIEVTNVPADTKDKDDEIMEIEFFDNRQAFHSLCQGNHYQFDTLRRAKHSSMMVLYHLHNPTAPAFVSTCNICQNDIETGQGWRCEICPDYDLCNVCYQKDDSVKHPHKLTAHPSLAAQNPPNQEARQHWVLQHKMLDLLIHACRCFYPQCAYQDCQNIKYLFYHGTNCKIRAAEGCRHCRKMWRILDLHARACKDSECRVPRCKDLKQQLRRSQNQMESRRRADVMEMMRNRAAQIARDTY